MWNHDESKRATLAAFNAQHITVSRWDGRAAALLLNSGYF